VGIPRFDPRAGDLAEEVSLLGRFELMVLDGVPHQVCSGWTAGPTGLGDDGEVVVGI
jgi:hypothetical protein